MAADIQWINLNTYCRTALPASERLDSSCRPKRSAHGAVSQTMQSRIARAPETHRRIMTAADLATASVGTRVFLHLSTQAHRHRAHLALAILNPEPFRRGLDFW